MTHALPQHTTPQARPADRRPESRPARPDGDADAITALTAIALGIPAHLLAPWLPGALATLSRRGKTR